MAIAPDVFAIENALESVWESPDILSGDQKTLIRACLPEDTEYDRPSSEEDLEILQRVLASCDFLDGIEIDGGAHWLSDHGREFPAAIRRFVHQVACRFHLDEHQLPGAFSTPLSQFVHVTKSHVATLNYDPLLYASFVDSGVLAGYRGALIDGMTTRQGFQAKNLLRKDKSKLGWYLHLHGSPLFYDDAHGVVRKLRRCDLEEHVIESTHLVLTHVRHKSAIIGASNVLSQYWLFLDRALRESEELVLFGYSGFDIHLNERIAKFVDSMPVRVVEWSGAQPAPDRDGFWRDRLRVDVEVLRFEDILEFSDW